MSDASGRERRERNASEKGIAWHAKNRKEPSSRQQPIQMPVHLHLGPTQPVQRLSRGFHPPGCYRRPGSFFFDRSRSTSSVLVVPCSPLSVLGWLLAVCMSLLGSPPAARRSPLFLDIVLA